MLKIENLHVAYGGIQALRGISLEVPDGKIVTLIGANGAGKSTTLRTITGLVKAQSGSINWNGEEILGKAIDKIVTAGIAMSPEGRRVFPDMTVLENLKIGAYLRKDKAEIEKDIQWVYSLFPRLEERSWQLAGTLSGGEQQMLAVGRALMSRPKLMMLDEPSLGLAPLVVQDIFKIIQEINRRLCERLWNFFPGDWDRIARMAIVSYDYVHMANMLVAMSYSVNGVSKLHGEILKEETFHDYNLVMPEKFSAITNGITHRRWLINCNPELTDLINESIGTDWIREPENLSALRPFADDAAFQEKFAAIKHHNKERLAKLLLERQNAVVDPDFMFDVQAKRLHEYKRQMLNALHILVLYNRIVNDESFVMQPRVFIFGAKASPGYYRAKQIIRMICAISSLIQKHPRARKMLQVVFLENYDVSSAEVLIPAAEVSEQLSTASKEASGTGNMKFMMNGAVTIGTMDGANVEISEQVGMDNIYIFGMRADTVRDMYRENNYNPMMIFETNHEVREAMTQMIDGTLTPGNPGVLQELYHSLLLGGWGSMGDSYFVLKDFGSYTMAQKRLDKDYQNKAKWRKMAITNTAMSGIFSSDRTITEYNDQIWHLKKMTLTK